MRSGNSMSKGMSFLSNNTPLSCYSRLCGGSLFHTDNALSYSRLNACQPQQVLYIVRSSRFFLMEVKREHGATRKETIPWLLPQLYAICLG